jgi:hypothetical protein
MNNLKTVLLLRNPKRTILHSGTILLLALLSGCGFYRASKLVPDYYYLNPNKDLAAIGRTALVELDNDSSYPQISTDVTEALFQALQKKQIFGLIVVRQNDPAWRSLQLDLDTGSQTQNSAFEAQPTYTLEQLFVTRKTLKCNAILIGSITKYQPYPHMAIGLRLKLVDLKDGQLLWALEQIWDSADKKTEHRIKDYFQSQVRSGLAPLHERLMVVSSLKFIKFVAHEVGETLLRKSQHPKFKLFVRKRVLTLEKNGNLAKIFKVSAKIDEKDYGIKNSQGPVIQ